MAAPGSEKEVELGFVEETVHWRLLSHFFPSKVGGFPAWLSLKPVPELPDLQCKHCSKPTAFLLQIYAPIGEQDTCFHRTLFMFICRDPECSKLNDSSHILVFRSQLSRNNDFYSDQPPNEDIFDPTGNFPSLSKLTGVCVVCGCAGRKRCGKCHSRAFCSKDHQTMDWKAGHKRNCGSTEQSEYKSNFTFPEYDIVMEPEDLDGQKTEKSEAEKLKEYDSFMQSKHGQKLLQGEDKTLEAMAQAETEADKVFSKFQKRIKHEPEQILRYDRGGEALWATSSHIPTPQHIPNCPCGASRQFEFQVMPQLLNHLDVDTVGTSIDWGVVAVFTCSQSCDTGNKYVPEVVWKQDFLPEKTA